MAISMNQQNFNKWLEKIIQTEKPGDEVIAYYFGIFEASDGFKIYLIGSAQFDEEDSDWACNLSFEPIEKYLILDYVNADCQAVLEDVKLLINNFIQSSVFKNSFLYYAKAIATGFDNGDLFRIK
jgi:hypothetical protein